MLGKIIKTPEKAIKKLKSRFAKIGNSNIVILDFREHTIRLPNGDIIKPNDILNFDPQTKTIIYRSPSGELKTITLQPGESIVDKAVQSILQNLAIKNNNREGVMHI